MRFVYTLLFSGLLIFQEVPMDQHPPTTTDDVPYQVVMPALVDDQSLPAVHFSTQYKPNFSVYHKIEKGAAHGGAGYAENAAPTPSPSPFPTALNKASDTGASYGEVQATASPVAKLTSVDTALATYRQQSTLPVTGYAMYYNPNVMQEVLNNRMRMGHISACPECIGNVALLRAGDLNRRVWLEWADGTIEGPFLVADTAATHHVAQLLARNWVVDVDNRTAVRRGMVGPVMVTVWGTPPTGQVNTPPFMPLYSAMPTAFPTALPTATATAVNSLPPTPFPTALPTVASMPTAVPAQDALPTVAVENTASAPRELVHAFPTDTPIPTVTPLPVIEPTATPVSTATLPPTATLPATATSVPTATLVPTETPTLTPSPSPSPLPPLSPTAMDPSALEKTESTPLAQRGFPTDTPVPTITPLPFIYSTPTPVPN